MTKTSFVCSVLLVWIALVISVAANDSIVEKYRNYTPEQLRELPQETIHSEVPMMYTMAAGRGLSNGAELVFGMELNTLMYPGLHDFEAAVKAFQKDLGDEPTGTLTVWQIHNLQQRAEMQKLGQLIFPDQWSSWKSDDLASVQGTVTLIDDQIAWPINHVKIECNKQLAYCQWDQIHVQVPDKDSLWSRSYHVIEQPTEFFDITRWTENEIEAVPNVQTSTMCRTMSLILNFKTKEFYEIARNAGGDCKVLGVELEPLKKPRVAQVVDGDKIIREEFRKVRRAAFDVLASNIRGQLTELFAEEESTTQEKD